MFAWYWSFLLQAIEKLPFATLNLSFVIAVYTKVRLIPHDIARLAADHF
jgi:hypothetical protein